MKVLTLILVLSVLSACSTGMKKTTKNHKPLVGQFLGSVLKGDVETMRKLANSDYIQHNPYIPTGLEPFIKMLPVLKKAGTTAENIRMFQDGDYVFMHNIWRNAKPFGADEMVSFDIIRIDENGKVAEHWDAMTALRKKTASGRSQTDGPTKAKDFDKTEQNKARARALVEDVLMGKNPNNLTKHISSKMYHQHNPDIKDGLNGIVQAVKYLQSKNNMFQYTKIHKVLGEGNFVLTISEGKWNKKNQVFYDLFRIENDQAVEHWDVIQEIPTKGLANNNGMFGF
jgi:predicted SnoaL-like aldol condensation-catalyzing enzyme